tara:strand:- start:1257 stop:1367 length:111 start_codon:yes stop_codon:yes gene_type:complete
MGRVAVIKIGEQDNENDQKLDFRGISNPKSQIGMEN